jgi:prepilin peptidase CpaA
VLFNPSDKMTVFLVAAVLVAGAAAWTDFRTGHIPNAITFGAFGVAPFAHIVDVLVHHGTKVEALVSGSYAILGGAVCLILPAVLYRLNAIGGGDLKLFVALGALLHPAIGGETEMWSFLAAGALAPFLLAYHGKLFQTLHNTAMLAVNPFLAKEKRRDVSPEQMSWFRMGPAIFVATVFVAFQHWKDAPGPHP